MSNSNQSEVAQMRQQIEAEFVAMQQMKNGPALGTARHNFITARLEQAEKIYDDLCRLVGEKEAAQILVEANNKLS